VPEAQGILAGGETAGTKLVETSQPWKGDRPVSICRPYRGCGRWDRNSGGSTTG